MTSCFGNSGNPDGNSPDTAKVDFSRGPAKEWYDDMIDGLKPFLAANKVKGG